MTEKKQPKREPDRSKGEYVARQKPYTIKVCKACKTPPESTRHTCGLKGLQDMFRF